MTRARKRADPCPRRAYLICCLPRTGSWLLAERLRHTGVAGVPREYFRVERFTTPNGHGVGASLVPAVLQSGTGRNGVFGAKVMWPQFRALEAHLRATTGEGLAPLPELLGTVFGHIRWVWLRRADTLRQAISYYRAIKTNVWWIRRAASQGDTRPPPTFDFEEIRRLRRLLSDFDRAWLAFFDEHRIDPLELSYETLAEDDLRAVRAVLRHVGLRPPRLAAFGPPPLSRQADRVSEDWVHRYVTEERLRMHDPALHGWELRE